MNASPLRFELLAPEYGPGHDQGLHRHAHSSLSLVLRGGVLETAAGREHRGAALALIVKPAQTPHADQFQPSTRLCSIALPAKVPLGPYRWIHRPKVGAAALAVYQHYRAGAGGPGLQEAVETLVRRVRESAPSVPPAPNWAETALQGLRQGRGSAELAAQLGMHRVHFARAFRRAFGLSPRQQKVQWRLQDAAQLLADTALPLSSVALDAGFADQAHLGRSFRSLLGLTPRHYRTVSQS